MGVFFCHNKYKGQKGSGAIALVKEETKDKNKNQRRKDSL